MVNVFEKNVIKTWGDKGQVWLKTLSTTVEVVAQQWNLTNLALVENLSFNYVMTGTRGQTPVELKIGCDQSEIGRERATLKAYKGNGSVRLLESNMDFNALLLEQVIPGTSLVSLFPDRDDEALEIAAVVMQRLHAASIPSDANMPTLDDELRALYRPHPGLNPAYVHKAQSMAKELLATQPRHVLLHGDLHHDNILNSQRGWLAIDPKGLVGDPAYEVCAFIRNPYPDILKPRALIVHRIKLFSQYLGIDEQRLHAWVYVRAVLEACWAMNSGETDPEVALAGAKRVLGDS